MGGSNMTSTTMEQVREAARRGDGETDMAKVRAGTPYVWDGKNDDERPLTAQEMQTGVERYRKQRGRPTGSVKESTTIRLHKDILAAFRAGGPGWQTRLNAALREWLETHPPA